MGRWSDSVKITKTVLRMIREDKALLLLPLLSGLTLLAAAAIVFIPLIVAFLANPSGMLSFAHSSGGQALLVVVFLVLYFVLVFLSIFFFAALVGAATLKLNGKNASVRDGLNIAWAKRGRLLVWALISATVGLLIQAVASRFKGIVGLIIRVAGGATWAVATYFVVPVILYEENSAWRSLVRSAKLFAGTFGRWFFSNLLLGLIVAAVFLVGFVTLIIGVFALFTSVPLGAALILIAVAIWIFASVFSAAVAGVTRAVLYRYATTGLIDPGLAPSNLPSVGGFGFNTPPPPLTPPPPPLPSYSS
ncbi:MAG TPA: DUF6159 family protein [Thermoplasmata archaeon]|nr:DUF6159 family protein [Thermoplasmata archaeon]